MEKIILYVLSIFFVAALAAGGCLHKRNRNNYQPFVSEVVHPEWSKDAVLYEVNIRQFTPEGTFKAFTQHLPRLKELGVDILWLMPIHPIGIKNRKDELGSYYSVRDYMKVNPEFGTLEDFKILLDKAHEAGFHVIMDWVPNHSSWDNPLTTEHPEFYVKDKDGNFIPPLGTDWTDVIQFDWTNKGLHEYMLNALKFWVELGVDGFRVDHPHKTPP
ncbi:MAG TPA: alpha-amylase family glycosyl hydrolase, partial [Bacteroidales bacterium]|nr:alpha-amylase family glycosyl hydrolase [Bacteroidales bacterium]